jgi:hypothetical protein
MCLCQGTLTHSFFSPHQVDCPTKHLSFLLKFVLCELLKSIVTGLLFTKLYSVMIGGKTILSSFVFTLALTVTWSMRA